MVVWIVFVPFPALCPSSGTGFKWSTAKSKSDLFAFYSDASNRRRALRHRHALQQSCQTFKALRKKVQGSWRLDQLDRALRQIDKRLRLRLVHVAEQERLSQSHGRSTDVLQLLWIAQNMRRNALGDQHACGFGRLNIVRLVDDGGDCEAGLD